MSSQIAPLLAQNSGQVMENLANTEKRLVDVNQKLIDLVNQYNHLNKSDDLSIFFDIHTIYFWLVMGGLFLLVIGLLLLRSELKKTNNISNQSTLGAVPKEQLVSLPIPEEPKIKSVREVIAEEGEKEPEPELIEEPVKPKVKKTKRPIKIKVVKVKPK